MTLSTGNRILVKNQSNAEDNGIYIVASNGAPTRASDYNAAGEVDAGDFVFVSGGTVNDNTGWIQTETITTVGTDSILFTQFSGAGTYTASTGLTLTGTAFSIDTATTVDKTTAQTLTNKTISGANNTLTVRLGNDVSGTLPVANGGTAITSYTAGDLVYASATDTLAKLAAGTNGKLLTMVSGAPAWADAPVSLPSQTGSSGKFLTTDGSTASWATVSSYSAPTLGSTSVSSGATVTTISALTLSGATLTGSLTAGGSAGTSGYVLTSTGSGVQWAAAAGGGGADEVKLVMGAY